MLTEPGMRMEKEWWWRCKMTKTFRENDRMSTVTYWQLPWGYLDPPPCRFPSTTPWSPWQTPWLTTPAKTRSLSTNLIISRPIYLHRRVACVDLSQVFVVQKVVRQLLSVAQALQTLLWASWKYTSYFDMIWSKLRKDPSLLTVFVAQPWKFWVKVKVVQVVPVLLSGVTCSQIKLRRVIFATKIAHASRSKLCLCYQTKWHSVVGALCVGLLRRWKTDIYLFYLPEEQSS